MLQTPPPDPARGTSTEAARERLALMPATDCNGPNIPDAPLWEQWREIYAALPADILRSQAQALAGDERRLAAAMHPDRAALAMIDMRLTLIEERLADL